MSTSVGAPGRVRHNPLFGFACCLRLKTFSQGLCTLTASARAQIAKQKPAGRCQRERQGRTRNIVIRRIVLEANISSGKYPACEATINNTNGRTCPGAGAAPGRHHRAPGEGRAVEAGGGGEHCIVLFVPPRSELDSPVDAHSLGTPPPTIVHLCQDPDLALARVLQDQERAFYLLYSGQQEFE